VNKLSEQVYALLRENVTWFEDAARYLRILSERNGAPDKEQWALLSAVYHERAEAHRKLLAEIALSSSHQRSPQSKPEGPSSSPTS
jgi:hypothetical protein